MRTWRTWLLPDRCLQVDVGNDHFGFEYYSVGVDARCHGFELLGEVRDVVRNTEEMLLELRGASLAGHLELRAGCGDGAPALNSEYVSVSDAIVEDDTPVDFDAFVAAGCLEAPARGRSPTGGPERIDLTLCIHYLDTAGNSALLNDIREYPLSTDQKIVLAPDQRTATLYCPSLPATEALVCWILGRADRVEVAAPAWLRAEVGLRVNAVQRRYAA